jgi:hypothetical protein
MGIYGVATSISRTKSKSIVLKLTDSVIKNQSQEFLLKKLLVKLDVVYTSDIRSLK